MKTCHARRCAAARRDRGETADRFISGAASPSCGNTTRETRPRCLLPGNFARPADRMLRRARAMARADDREITYVGGARLLPADLQLARVLCIEHHLAPTLVCHQRLLLTVERIVQRDAKEWSRRCGRVFMSRVAVEQSSASRTPSWACCSTRCRSPADRDLPVGWQVPVQSSQRFVKTARHFQARSPGHLPRLDRPRCVRHSEQTQSPPRWRDGPTRGS